MNEAGLKKAELAAQEFPRRVEALRNPTIKSEVVAAGAVRRQSMELTRALAEARRSAF